MIKILVLSALFIIAVSTSDAQNIINLKDIESLKYELALAKDDTTRALKMADLSYLYAIFNVDSCNAYGNKALQLSQKHDFIRGEARALFGLADGLSIEGDFPGSLELLFKALKIAEENHFLFESSLCLEMTGIVYWNLSDYQKAHDYYKKAKERYAVAYKGEDKYIHLKGWTEINLAQSYADIHLLDSSLAALQAILKDENADPLWHPIALHLLGDVYSRMKQINPAINALKEAIEIHEIRNDQISIADACGYISNIYKQTNRPDSVIFYSKKGLSSAESIGYKWSILLHCQLLAEAYEANNLALSHQYLKKVIAVNNALYGAEKTQALQKTLSGEQERLRQAEAERIAEQNQLKQYAFLSGLAILLIIAFILYRNNKQKLKANKVLETTLTNLKSTQAQLVQSEKMASLGELTAGIAHEIQNPLNFVNNFSEINKELLIELKEEAEKGNVEEVKVIANDVIDNSEKINHHGKRADAIVRGMLQHSRQSSGTKEPTDINALADEYLRLSYHGLRAKDKTFNATINTSYDASIGNINIIPQDIGRVLLNLYNNAFYAVNEKKNQQPEGYEPTVLISTKKIGDKVEIKVADNGKGVPQKIVDKIFQPFFTTKPTGQGTGLGLSLSYDIVKAHGGELKVETNEGSGSTFIIQIPKN
jgi:two-component system NtrC family sensor kinase